MGCPAPSRVVFEINWDGLAGVRFVVGMDTVARCQPSIQVDIGASFGTKRTVDNLDGLVAQCAIYLSVVVVCAGVHRDSY